MDISKEFEYILLKSILEKSDYFSRCYHLLKEKYFTISGNKEIFKMISEYYSEYRKVPTLVEIVTLTKDVPNSEIRKEIAESLKKVNESKVIENPAFNNSDLLKDLLKEFRKT